MSIVDICVSGSNRAKLVVRRDGISSGTFSGSETPISVWFLGPGTNGRIGENVLGESLPSSAAIRGPHEDALVAPLYEGDVAPDSIRLPVELEPCPKKVGRAVEVHGISSSGHAALEVPRKRDKFSGSWADPDVLVRLGKKMVSRDFRRRLKRTDNVVTAVLIKVEAPPIVEITVLDRETPPAAIIFAPSEL
jgi:hypothetical protein